MLRKMQKKKKKNAKLSSLATKNNHLLFQMFFSSGLILFRITFEKQLYRDISHISHHFNI